MSQHLNQHFHKAFQSISELQENLPPDVMLKFYAYYKQATQGDNFYLKGKSDIRDAFKFNAWTQLNGMSQEEAKQKYIDLAKDILNTNFND